MVSSKEKHFQVLFGQNSMLACYCSDEDYCNAASPLRQTSFIKLLSIFLVLRVIGQW